MSPKKGKSAKASSASPKKNDDEADETVKASYSEQIAEDPDFFIGTGKFNFPNGDKYEGQYCAHAQGLIWREGTGTYTTKDGQVYTGVWDGDRLVENKDLEITYPDGSKYFGQLVNGKYAGTGVYQLQEKVSLTCNFTNNKPTGEITLIDPNGKSWHGFAENDESLLIQEHPFYRSIGQDLGKGRFKPKIRQLERRESRSQRGSRKSDAAPEESPEPVVKYRDLRHIEQEIFAKSKMTPSDLNFDKSEWYQEYVKYRDTYGAVIRQVMTSGETSLTIENYEWYNKYKEFEKKYLSTIKEIRSKSKIKGKTSMDDKLFQFIHSEEYKEMTKPTRIYYPRETIIEAQCDECHGDEGDCGLN